MLIHPVVAVDAAGAVQLAMVLAAMGLEKITGRCT
jgi:hypothetical protein